MEKAGGKKNLFEVINRLENHFLVFGFAILIVVGFIQVVMRTVFNNSLSWSEELIRYIYIWLCWVGISLTQRRGEHIQLTFVLDMLPRKVQDVLKILVSRDEKSRTFSSNSQRSHILRTSSRSIRLILSSIVSLAVSLKWTRTI